MNSAMPSAIRAKMRYLKRGFIFYGRIDLVKERLMQPTLHAILSTDLTQKIHQAKRPKRMPRLLSPKDLLLATKPVS